MFKFRHCGSCCKHNPVILNGIVTYAAFGSVGQTCGIQFCNVFVASVAYVNHALRENLADLPPSLRCLSDDAATVLGANPAFLLKAS